MEYVDEYRDPGRIQNLVAQIRKISRKPVKLMEVCGTHTVTIFRNGIRDLLPDHVSLISGPGCPVCVTSIDGVDRAIALAQEEEITIATFGDMIRVPGSETSLLEQRAEGADVRIVYSAYDALLMAQRDMSRHVVFLGVGFEATAPTIAAVIQRAREAQIDNFTVLSMHKVLPPALKALVHTPELEINGFICPGHVSTIIGTDPYVSIVRDFGVPCVVARDLSPSMSFRPSVSWYGRLKGERQVSRFSTEGLFHRKEIQRPGHFWRMSSNRVIPTGGDSDYSPQAV